MNKPKDPQPNPHSARALLNRLAASLATLARCAEQIAKHLPPGAQLDPGNDPKADERAAQAVENTHPPRKRGRPVKYQTQAEREAARRAQCNAAFKRWIAKPENKARRRAQQRARVAAKTAPADLRTPADMPRQALRVGACYALGMRYSAIAAALDMPKGTMRNAMHRFNQHAGLTSIGRAKDWFDAMRADPAAHAPHADRRQWATAYAKRATTEARRRAGKRGWIARRRRR